MQDTSPEILKKINDMMQLKTPQEKLEMSWSMYRTSRQLIIQSIINQNPDISAVELRKELFLKFYKDDFTLSEQEKIIDHLLRHSSGG